MHLVALTKGVDTHKFLSWTFSHACHQRETNSRYARVYKLQIYQNTHVVNIDTWKSTMETSHDIILTANLFTDSGGETSRPTPLSNQVAPTKSDSSKPVIGHKQRSRTAPLRNLPNACPTRVGSSAQLLAEGTLENQGQCDPLHSSCSKRRSSFLMSGFPEEPLMKASIAP